MIISRRLALVKDYLPTKFQVLSGFSYNTNTIQYNKKTCRPIAHTVTEFLER